MGEPGYLENFTSVAMPSATPCLIFFIEQLIDFTERLTGIHGADR